MPVSSERSQGGLDRWRVPLPDEQAPHKGLQYAQITDVAPLDGAPPLRRLSAGSYNDRARQVTGTRRAAGDQGSKERRPCTREQLALAVLRLRTRHMDILRLLHDHPLLSPAELAAVLAIQETSTARYLSCLRREGLVCAMSARPGTLGWSASMAVKFTEPCSSLPHGEAERRAGFRGDRRDRAGGARYLLTDDGVRFLAASLWLRSRSQSETTPNRSATRRQARRAMQDEDVVRAYRGCVAGRDLCDLRALLARPHLRTLLRYPAHTAGVYTFFAMLLRAAEYRRLDEDGHELLWWETGAACVRRYRYHGCWRNVRPDGAGEYCAGGASGRRLPFWLESDRGTMGLRDLHDKLMSYAEYVASREWMRGGTHALLQLLIITADGGAETRVVRALKDALPPHTPLAVRVASAPVLYEYGPLGNTWRPWVPGRSPGHGALGASRSLVDW